MKAHICLGAPKKIRFSLSCGVRAAISIGTWPGASFVPFAPEYADVYFPARADLTRKLEKRMTAAYGDLEEVFANLTPQLACSLFFHLQPS